MGSMTYADLGEASLVWISPSQGLGPLPQDPPPDGDVPPPEGNIPPAEELFEGTSVEERP